MSVRPRPKAPPASFDCEVHWVRGAVEDHLAIQLHHHLVVRVEGPQFGDRSSRGVRLARHRCGDANVEEANAALGLFEDIQRLRLDAAAAARDTGVVGSGEDNLVDLLALAEVVVGDHAPIASREMCGLSDTAGSTTWNGRG
jgi:hypothetical protein